MDEDTWLIIGIVLFCFGGLLLLIVVIRLITWFCRAREHAKQERERIKKLEHLRHLEEYSIRTADTGSDYTSLKKTLHTPQSVTSGSVFRYDELDGVNPTYVVDDLSQLPPGTYLRFHRPRSTGSSTGVMTPVDSVGRGGGYSPDESRMAEVSEVTVAHSSGREGLVRVMVPGTDTGAVSAPPISASEPALNEERFYYPVGAKIEPSSNSYSDIRRIDDIPF